MKSLEESVILSAAMRCGLATRKELGDASGIKEQTLRSRFYNPEHLRIWEIRDMAKVVDFTIPELLAVLTGKEVKECERDLQSFCQRYLRGQ